MSDRGNRRASNRPRKRPLGPAVALVVAAIAAFAFGVVLGASAGSGDRTGDRAADRASSGPVDRDEREANAGRGDRAGAGEEPVQVTGFDRPVPILMYHGIGAPPEGAALPALFVPVPEFREQIRWLADEGYVAVTLADVFDAWKRGAPIARKPVVLTFDDGLRGQYVGALPVLVEMNWPGVLNLKVESLDQGELTEAMVGEMVAAGWDVESHTVTHADVSALSGEALRREIAGSRRELRRRLDVPVRFFAYPGGRYSDEAIAALRAAGYLGAMTTEPGLATPDRPYELQRIRVDGGDGAGGLAAKLKAAEVASVTPAP